MTLDNLLHPYYKTCVSIQVNVRSKEKIFQAESIECTV